MNRFDQCLTVTLRHEGGWSDHPSDKGGATMKGITIGVYSQWKGRRMTKAELRAITDDEVRTIYRRNYWDKVRADELPPGLDLVAFDGAVNSGPSRGIRWLQVGVGADQDGKIGPATVAAAQAADRAAAINAACDARLAFVRGLKTWPTFGRGWSSRIADIRSQALRMATPAPARPAQPQPAAPAPTPAPTPRNGLADLWALIVALFRRNQ